MKKLFFLLGLMIIALVAYSQDYEYDPSAEISLDPKTTYGELDNGLTYYIRENSYPENRAEFYLVVNAGAILEDNDQDGLAHFTEHMAFNGTENFEKKEIINYLQSIGMKFGPEINAFTSHDVTTYMLQKVPVDVPENIDTSLMVLYDWAYNLAFEDEEIDAERGVIHEEWRTRRGAEFRMMTKANEVLYQGSKYAERDVIGDIDIIDNFEYETIKRFYRDWYRPDLQAIVAVGDFDGDVIEAKIKEIFGQEPARENPKEREYFNVPDHEETLVTIQTDKEARYAIVQLFYKHDIDKMKDASYYRHGMLESLYSSMLNARFQELLQSENPPFIFGTSVYTNIVRTKDAYLAYAVANEKQLEDALRTLLLENERVKKFGFTETELERARKDYMVKTEKQFKERDKKESQAYVWEYYDHFLRDEPAPGIEFDYAFVKSLLPGVTLEEINNLAKEWITDENRVVVMMGPEKEDFEMPTKEEVLRIMDEVEDREIAAYEDKVSDEPLIPVEPEAVPVASVTEMEKFEATEWTFPNNVKVVIKPTDFKEDEILMTAFSMGGTSLYDVDELISADFSATIALQSGLGTFDQVSLQKKLAGKIVQLYPTVSGVFEGFNGSVTPTDLETMLKMINLYFTDPRIDETAFNALMKRYKDLLENKELNPASTLQDTVLVTNASYHPRVRPMSVELLDEAKLNDIEWIFDERFGDPSGFTFYFVGNIDPEEVKPMFEKYIGSLPKITRDESFIDRGIRPPEGTVKKTVYRRMEVPKSTVSITFHGEYDFDNFQDRMNLSALSDILDVRYVETVREEQGGTYGVGVRPGQDKYPYEHYSVRIYFDCDPSNVDNLKAIIYDEIEKLKAEGPKLKDLNGVKENKIKNYQENLERNQYWLTAVKNKDFLGTSDEVIFEYEKYIDNLTVENLREAANRFFTDQVVEVVLLPENMEENVVNPMSGE